MPSPDLSEQRRPARLVAALLLLAAATSEVAGQTNDGVGWWGRPAAREDVRRGEVPNDEPARMYRDARSELDGGQTAQGQRKLELLVARFPNSPLADVARRDLQRLYAGSDASARAGSPRPGETPRLERPDERRPATAVSTAPEPQVPNRLQIAMDDLRQKAGDRVFFGEQSFELGPRAHIALQAQAEWLTRHASATVTLEGHADDHGGRDHNVQMALKRAEAVRLRLVDLGIAPDRIEIESFGRDQPVADCPQKHCAEQNRRVVIMITRAPSAFGIDVVRRGPQP